MIIPTIFLVILGGVLAYVLRRHLKQQKVKQVLGLILGVVFFNSISHGRHTFRVCCRVRGDRHV